MQWHRTYNEMQYIFREVSIDIASCIRLNDWWPVTVKIKVGGCYIGNLKPVFHEPQRKNLSVPFSNPAVYCNAVLCNTISYYIHCNIFIPPRSWRSIDCSYCSYSRKTEVQNWMVSLLHSCLLECTITGRLYICLVTKLYCAIFYATDLIYIYIYMTTHICNLCFISFSYVNIKSNFPFGNVFFDDFVHRKIEFLLFLISFMHRSSSFTVSTRLIPTLMLCRYFLLYKNLFWFNTLDFVLVLRMRCDGWLNYRFILNVCRTISVLANHA